MNNTKMKLLNAKEIRSLTSKILAEWAQNKKDELPIHKIDTFSKQYELESYKYFHPDGEARKASSEAELLFQNMDQYSHKHMKRSIDSATDPVSKHYYKRRGFQDVLNVDLYRNRLIKEQKECIQQFEKRYLENLQESGLNPSKSKDILTTCDDRETRKEEEKKFLMVEKNVKLLKQLLEERQCLANMMNYNTYSDYVMSGLHLKDPKRAKEFLYELNDSLEYRAEEEKKKLSSVLNEYNDIVDAENEEEFKVQSYDLEYCLNELKRSDGIDQEKLREYFPYKETVKNVLKLYSNLLGIDFVWDINNEDEVETSRDTEIETYSMINSMGDRIGILHLDLFQREGKFPTAVVVPISKPERHNYGESILIMNLQPVAKEKGFTHDDVVTLVHEMGHAMHSLLANKGHPRYTGCDVIWDTVEVVSMFFENYAYYPKSLKIISPTLPESFVEIVYQNRINESAMKIKKQIMYSLIDLELHNSDSDNVKDVVNKISKKIMGYEYQDGTDFTTIWTQLVGDYQSQYYGYLWSKQWATQYFDLLVVQGEEFISNTLFNFVSNHNDDHINYINGQILKEETKNDYSLTAWLFWALSI